jgi:Peptidase A4 family
MKFLKLLPAAVLACGAIAAAPLSASASAPAAAHSPVLPVGVSVAGPMRYAPQLAHLAPRDPLAHPGPVRSNILVSGNWAGMVELPRGGNRTFTAIGTRFRMPVLTAAQQANCETAASESSTGFAEAAQWTGLDGWSDGTVEQVGATTYCGEGASDSIYAWYEMYPADPVVYTFTGVNPGDSMIAITTFKNGKYDLFLSDTTNGARFNADVPCSANGGAACDNSSAEVITEDPGGTPANGAFLADYGNVSYSVSRVTAHGVTGLLNGTRYYSGWHTWEEFDGTVMQSTSNLNSTQDGFSNSFAAPF